MKKSNCFKTAKAALCYELVSGSVLSIKTCFKELGITNLPREIGRAIERLPDGKGSNGFGVIISKVRKRGKTKYGTSCTWVEYHLNKTAYNKPGIKRMKEYVKLHCYK